MGRPRQLRLWLSLAAAVVVVLLQQQSMFTSVTRQSTSDATAAELASTRQKLRVLQQQLKQAQRGERISVAEGAADVFLSDDLNACPSRDDYHRW